MMGHYDEQYFHWQDQIACKMGGYNARKYYSRHIKPTDTVLDVGCGGGHMLKNIACKEKYGIEINPSAARQAFRNGLIVHDSLSKIGDKSVDVAIFSHSLEHMPRPLETLRQVNEKLSDNGRLIVHVPLVNVSREDRYYPEDVNKHLYSWTPLQLGNLLSEAGYVVKESGYHWECYPPFYRILIDVLPISLFDLLGGVWSRVIGIGYVYCVATKYHS